MYLGRHSLIRQQGTFTSRSRLHLTDPIALLAQQVMLKDKSFYDANLIHGSLQVMYQFPMTIKKSHSMWFVKVFGDFSSASTSGHPNLYNVGFSIGLFN